MKYIATVFAAAALLAAQGNIPSEPETIETVGDPHVAELKKAQDEERKWKSLDISLNHRLEGAGVCTSDPGNLIRETSTARVQSLKSFAAYFDLHRTRWRDSMDRSVGIASDRAPDRHEISTAIAALQREKADLERRQTGLAQALASQDTPEASRTSASLAALIARKRSQLERSTETLRQFDTAQDYLKQRREFARVRLRDIAELVEDLKGEGKLWEHLYNGMTHGWELRCDKATPKPGTFDAGYWRTRP